MQAKKEIKRITEQIVKKYKPEKIILYGSFAYGKPHEDSDVDLMIIKKTKKARRQRIEKILEVIKTCLPVEPLVYTPQEFAERISLGDFFIQDIAKKGQILYEKTT